MEKLRNKTSWLLFSFLTINATHQGAFSEYCLFYYEEFKPLYAEIHTEAKVPVEMLFEVNAAFDHLSRHWKYAENECEVVKQASAHLKRGCFDAFKLVVKSTRKKYDEIEKIDISIIDNGNFEKNLHSLWNAIKAKAKEARMAEGDSREAEQWHSAFEIWKDV